MGKKRIKSGKLPSSQIQPSSLPRDDRLNFCFRHLDLQYEKFHIANCKLDYLSKLLERLKNLSTMRYVEVISNRSDALRAHPIKWQETTEPAGFSCLDPQLRDKEAYQLSVSKNKGRIHGLFLDNTFFVVWLDPDHRLY